MSDVTQEQVVEYIKGITVIELSQLVKTLEDELGVAAPLAMPVAVAGRRRCSRGADGVYGNSHRHWGEED